MLIRCDGCGERLDKEVAVPALVERGLVAWFCSEACRVRSRHVAGLEAIEPADPAAAREAPVDEDGDLKLPPRRR